MSKIRKVVGWNLQLCHTCKFAEFRQIFQCRVFGDENPPTCAEVRAEENNKKKALNSSCSYWKPSYNK